MEFRILGSLEVVDEGSAVRLGGAMQRSLLGVLLLHANEVVPRGRLIDELWADSPPETAQNALQVHVSQLRKALGAERIETLPRGYRLRVEAGELDLGAFEKLLSDSRQAPAADAARGLRQALDLWRGPVLADLWDGLARAERARLEEERMYALELRIAADLDLGRHEALVAELNGLVREHPLRERLRGQLMLALYRSGRQADALEVYRLGRRALAEELGLEPDDALQRLEKAILVHDPSLDAAGVDVGELSVSTTPATVAGQPRGSSRGLRVPPDSVALIDQERGEVVGSVLVGRRPVALTFGHGSLWVANADDGTVSRIDPDRLEVVRTIGIGAPAIDLAIGPDALWVGNGSDGTVSRIDPAADAIVETIDLRGASELAWNPVYAVEAGAGAVWVAVGPHHLARIDPATNEPVAIIDVGDIPVDLCFDGEAVWVATMAARAVRVEAGTHTPTIEVPVGYPIALTAGEGAVLVSGRERIWQIDPSTAVVTQMISVGQRLMGLCISEGAVWAADNGSGAIIRIDRRTGQIDDSVTVGHAPTAVASRDGTVWASIQSESAIDLYPRLVAGVMPDAGLGDPNVS